MPIAPPPSLPDDLSRTFAALRASLRSYLRKRVGDAAAVDDLVQDVFVKATAAIRAGRAPSNLTGWLYAAARSTAVDHFRATRPATEELDEDLLDPGIADDALLHQELANCLRPLAQRLPAIYRDTLLAADFDGQPLKALAERQGVSLSAIKSRASRARSMLKERLLACCHVETAGGLVADYHRRSADRCQGRQGGCQRGCG